MPRTTAITAALAAAIAPAGAIAQWRCDCTTVVDSCTAEVTARENWIEVTTDSRQCARVDYFVDGLPFVATVVEGQERLDWMSPRADPDILVQSCQVCSDNAAGREPAARQPPAPAEDGPLEPLIRWNPDFPAEAQRRGIEGHVTVAFDVTADGAVENASVVESEPGDIFDRAALDAVRRWRYLADEERAATRVTERIDFSLADMIWRLRPAEDAGRADAATGLPRNECVREDAVYDYGEMLEAELINACQTPLLVYGCAEGVGPQARRWVCTMSERAGELLVRPGDGRAGDTYQDGKRAGSVDWLTYRESFFVARAPNTQYWWIACEPQDSACRDDATMWLRSMHGQPSSVDPRGRGAAALARSY